MTDIPVSNKLLTMNNLNDKNFETVTDEWIFQLKKEVDSFAIKSTPNSQQNLNLLQIVAIEHKDICSKSILEYANNNPTNDQFDEQWFSNYLNSDEFKALLPAIRDSYLNKSLMLRVGGDVTLLLGLAPLVITYLYHTNPAFLLIGLLMTPVVGMILAEKTGSFKKHQSLNIFFKDESQKVIETPWWHKSIFEWINEKIESITAISNSDKPNGGRLGNN